MRTPARRTIELFIQLHRPLSPQALANFGEISIRAARGMLCRLTRIGVLHDDGTGGYGPGENAAAWIETEPRTRPGGSSRKYQIDKQRRELAAELNPKKDQYSMRRRARAADVAVLPNRIQEADRMSS